MYLEYEDAVTLKEGEKITLMKWGNVLINKIETQGDSLTLTANLLEDDKDYKSTKKINWLPKCDLLVTVHLNEYDHLLKVDKVDDNTDFDSALNEKTKFTTEAYADPGVKNLQRCNLSTID